MSISADEVLKQALELDPPERARLVTELLATLEPDSTLESLGDADWIAEIERRARAALAGGRTFSWEESRRHVEEKFERR
jgi:hypothetical protein